MRGNWVFASPTTTHTILAVESAMKAVSRAKCAASLSTSSSGPTWPTCQGSRQAAAKPIVVAPVREKKATPLKHLGSLDKLFPR